MVLTSTLVLVSSAGNQTANIRTLILNTSIHQYQVHSSKKEYFCRKITPETRLKRSCSFPRPSFLFVKSSRCSDRNLMFELSHLLLPVHLLSVEIASQGGWVVTESEGSHHSFAKSSNIRFLLFHLLSWIPKCILSISFSWQQTCPIIGITWVSWNHWGFPLAE